MKKIVVFLFIIITSINSYAQFSKVHYIPPVTATYSTSIGGKSTCDPDVDQYIYISTPSPTPVTVTLTPLGGTPVINTVSNSTPWIYTIKTLPSAINGSQTSGGVTTAKFGFDNQLFVPNTLTGTVQKNRGFLIESTDLVYANLRVSSDVSGTGSAAKSSQAGGLVAKGTSAYGKEFRIGGMENKSALTSGNEFCLLNFASFVATEDNTTVTINLSNPAAIGAIMANGVAYSGPITKTLNKNETYVIAMQNSSSTTFESNYMLGGLITSDRNIVVNCGSIGGNSQIKNEIPAVPNSISFNTGGKDYGFDQIVPSDKTGKEYIFIGGAGMLASAKAYDLERVIIIANVNGTQVFKDGTILVATLAAGQYYVFNGNHYTNGNLYVKTSENVFAYQCIAGSNDAGNQNMFFVPPLTCGTPSSVNNIPLIEQVGIVTYTNAVVNITTEATAAEATPIITIGNTPISLTSLNSSRFSVTGKTGFYTYTYPKPGVTPAPPALVGNISVSAPHQVYVSYYGSNANATYGSYFSGFDTKSIVSSQSAVTGTSCIGNTTLNINGAIATDTFNWYYSTTPIIDPATSTLITGETTSSYTPKSITSGGFGPGYYAVSKLTGCAAIVSDPIAVSQCPVDDDNDGVFNNIDIDSDNDGITNIPESYGNKTIDVSVPSGTLAVGSYSNTYTNTTTTSGIGNSFTGNSNGSFTTNLSAGKTNSVTQNLIFTAPISLGIVYNPTAGSTVSSLSNGTFIIKSDIANTITVSNPSNQLLIDTNYDGIYENGVTQFSSLEIRFILNPAVLLATPAPAIDFIFQTYLANSISFTHQNLSDSQPNSSSFSFYAVNVPKDSDSDGINDQVDKDSDGDGILDIVESQIGNKTIATPFVDVNKNGLADNFEPIIAPVDTDLDGVPDFIDLDSDNDGILDTVENGATNLDPDADGIKNYSDLDSDGDTCNDVVEAGFTDPNADGKLGGSPITVDINGKVTSGTDGYTAPAGSPTAYYLIAATPVITVQPTANPNCTAGTAVISMVENGGNNIKWQVATIIAPIVWTDITNNAIYSGANTNTLTISSAANGFQYRAVLNKNESACTLVISDIVPVIFSNSPVVVDVTMEECDADLDGKTLFDLTAKNTQISVNSANETFTYYTSLAGANANNPLELISNPTTYTNTTAHTMEIGVRVANPAGCSSVSKITLNVGIQIPASYVFPPPPQPVCDDAVQDGFTTFDISATKTTIEALFPSTGYTVAYYPTQTDATNQTNAITNLSSYRNTIANTQSIWIRVNNNNANFNTCYTLATYFSLNVEALPVANSVTIPNQCDDNHDGKLYFNTSTLESILLGGQTNKTVTYFDAANNPLKDANGNLITSPFPNNFVTTSQTIKAVVTNNTAQKCSASTTISFVVETLPIANPVIIPNQCDDNNDGKLSFDTSTLESTVLGGQTGVTVTYFDAANNPLKDANGNLITSPFPNNFVTTSQTIKAVVTNSSGLNCSESTNIEFTVEPLPIANSVTIPTQCDDNHDGKLSFDTSTLESTLLGGQTAVSVTYFDAANNPLKDANGNLITSPFPNNFVTISQTIKAVVTNNSGLKCSASANIQFVVEPLPTANPVLIPKQCDDNRDGKLSFDTSTLESTLLGGQTGVTVTYLDAANNPLKDANGNLITSPFPNNFLTISQTIKAVVTNSTGLNCSESTNIQFTVEPLPIANPVLIPIQCDDNRDGKLSFNTTTLESTVLGGQTGVTVTYLDAANNPLKDANGNLITSPFPNNFVTTSQTIKAVVTNNTPQKCADQTSITFTIEPLPVANPVIISRQCDDDQDGILSFNTTSLESTILGGQTAVSVTYLDATNNPLKDANGNLITSPFPANFITSSQTITAVVKNNSTQGCSDKTTITFTIDIKPIANPVAPFVECDNESDPLLQDGKYTFDTSSIQSTILGTQTGMTIKYFDGNGNPLNPLPNPFTTATQTIKAVVENPLNTSCPATQFISFTVNSSPKINTNIDGNDDKLICSNSSLFTYDLDASLQDGSSTTNYKYQWSKDGVDLPGETAYTLNGVNTEGKYAVEVTNIATTCRAMRIINVSASEQAKIKSIEISDLTDNNTVTINLEPGLKGNYEFSLDDEMGNYQSSNVFTNVSPGMHQIFVRDINGCETTPDIAAVIGVPKFFTPNADGFNDFWNIRGISGNTKYSIYIYDRYGKLIKELIPTNLEGWDGTYNGSPLPGSDYWYSLKLDNGREAKGHFSLKR